MGYIKEPKGIDFTVIDHTLTEEERKKLSAYIEKRKLEIVGMRKKTKLSTLNHKKELNLDI